MVSLVQSIMTNIFGANSAYSKDSGIGTTTSLTSNGYTNNGNKSYSTIDNRFETYEMYAFVKKNHVTVSILTMLQSFISDMYKDSEVRTTINDHPNWEWWVNTTIKKADVKKKVINDLEDFLFWGQQGKYFTHDDNALKPLVHPTSFATYFENDVPKMVMLRSVSETKVKPVRYYNGLWLQYRPVTVKAFTKRDKNEKSSDKDLYFENEFRVGQSLFSGAVLKLYSLAIMEYLADQLALKEALKNEVLVANVADENTDMKDISQATEMISKLVNDQDSMSILSHSPDALLRLVDEKLVTYINVVPGIQNFTNFDKMELFSLRDKIQMLRDQIEQTKDDVYTTLGISKELMNGDGTKYDAIERSTRFVNLLQFINTSLIDSLKKFSVAQIYYKFGVVVPEDIIQFNMDSAAILSNADTAYKFKVLQETMQAVNDAANSYKDLTSNDAIDAEQAYAFFSKKLSAIDASLVGLVKKIEPEKESSDSGNEDSSW